MPDVVAFGSVFPGQEFEVHEAEGYRAVDDVMIDARIVPHALIGRAR